LVHGLAETAFLMLAEAAFVMDAEAAFVMEQHGNRFRLACGVPS